MTDKREMNGDLLPDKIVLKRAVASQIKKPREGYVTLVTDVCNELKSMLDNILRDTNERIIPKESLDY